MRGAITVLAALALFVIPACSRGGNGSPTVAVGLLRAVPAEAPAPLLATLRSGGFVPGENLKVFGSKGSETHPDPADARATVRRWVAEGVDLVIAYSSSGAAAAHEAAPDTEILFLVNDPSAVGLVKNEAAPEGRLTGVTFRVPADRTLDLARRAVPGLTTVGLLSPTDDPAVGPYRDAVTSAADRLGLHVVPGEFAGRSMIGSALDHLAASGAQAVVVANAPAAIRVIGDIQRAADARHLPLIANTDLATGAVVVLTPDTDVLQQQLGEQAVRLLDGAKPSAVPVEDPRRFRVVLNEPEASTLGLPAFPDDLVRQADEVIR